jgi:alpha-beta hydrolase superfamily lysophospholipase
VLLVVHGLGEHCGRYMNVVDHFVPLGYAVYGLDHIGHGKSAGEREMVESFADFADTLMIYRDMIAEWQKGKPIFLLGHSMGGAISAFCLLDHQEDFNGAVLSAPLVAIGEGVSPLSITMSKVLSRIAPKLGLVAVDVDLVSRDKDVVKAYVDDPLIFHGKTPSRLGAEMLAAMERITAEAGRIRLPFILVQGGADALVDPAGARMLVEKASSEDRTLKTYEGLYHEVFNEPEKEMVLKDVEAWLETHI